MLEITTNTYLQLTVKSPLTHSTNSLNVGCVRCTSLGVIVPIERWRCAYWDWFASTDATLLDYYRLNKATRGDYW